MIGIAGFGYVGQAVLSCLNHLQSFKIYDPPKGFDDIIELKNSHVIFCCLPTPTETTYVKNLFKEDEREPKDAIFSSDQDFSCYEEFFSKLGDYDGVLVIKSTVLYENIEPYLEKYNVVLNPEFLNQNTFHADFYRQSVIILGGRMDHARKVATVYNQCFELGNAPQFEYCTAEEACQVKYIHNIYHAYKVLFWNYVQDITNNQRRIFQLYSRIVKTSVENEMARVCADGKPGYGGACFPKDTAAFDNACPHALTKFMREYNGRLRGGD